MRKDSPVETKRVARGKSTTKKPTKTQQSKSKDKQRKTQTKSVKKAQNQSKSKSKVLKSKSVDQAAEVSDESDDSEQANIVYKKGSFIAFIDVRKENDEKFDNFAIGKVSLFVRYRIGTRPVKTLTDLHQVHPLT